MVYGIHRAAYEHSMADAGYFTEMRFEEIEDLMQAWEEVKKALTRLQFVLYEVDKIMQRQPLKRKS